MAKICFLHAGTHKTASTYLQNALQVNEYALASDGLYVPLSGRVSPSGHHNIAWELNGDARFDRAHGNLAQLVDELQSVQSPRVCLSSEDFEYLYANVEALRELRAKLNAAGYTVKALFFLRPQADYAESLYVEYVRHGLTLDFPEFLRQFSSGGFKQAPTPNYSLLLERFGDALGTENVVVRPFRISSRPQRILGDFLSVMVPDFKLAANKYRLATGREHVSIPFLHVFQLFLENNLKDKSKTIEIDAVSLAKLAGGDAGGCKYLFGPFDPVGLQDLVTTFWKLALLNLKVFRTHHVFVPVVSLAAFRRHLLAFVGVNLNSRRRRRVLDKYRHGSENMRAVAECIRPPAEPDSSVVQAAVPANAAGAEMGPGCPPPQSGLSMVEFQQQLRDLTNSLAQSRRELEQLRTEVAERDRQIRALKDRLSASQKTLRDGEMPILRRTAYRFLASVAQLRAVFPEMWRRARRLPSRLINLRFARLVIKSDLFDPEFYLAQSPELKDTDVDLVAHYLEFGAQRSRDPNPFFDTSFYLAHNRHVVRLGVNPLVHYITRGAREGRDPHPLFDTSYYMERNPDVVRAGQNPLSHFLRCGAREGRDPCPLFDISYYVEQNPDIIDAGVNPLVHFLQAGAREGRDPHVLFDTSYYFEQNPEAASTGLNPLEHFLRFGAHAGISPHPLFDVSYYKQQIPEAGGRGFNSILHFISVVNPIVHFLEYGAHEGRDPHPLFHTSYYLDSNRDVAGAGLNPLIHFIKRGAREGRDPHPLFDTSFYLENNPEVARDGANPLLHFILRGAREGRDPHPWFDTSFYLDTNPDVAKAGINPLVHFLDVGARQGRDPSPGFDVSYYLDQNPDVASSGMNPLVHFVMYGAREGRRPSGNSRVSLRH